MPKKFYERNGMEWIDKTSWSDGKIERDDTDLK